MSVPGCAHRHGRARRALTTLSKWPVSVAGLAINCCCLWLEFVGSVSKKPVKARLTHPKTPVLRTKQRLRPVTCKTAAELEEEEIEKIQQ